ncbi:MAG TPA: acetate kinase [Actinomycetales bacterium]|nr:acetate kinase [Actinomycetales bacterium]
MTRRVLVINSGSSSIKYQLIAVPPAEESEKENEVLASGLVERIGEIRDGRLRHDGPSGRVTREMPIADHKAGVGAVLKLFEEVGPSLEANGGLAGVGHRVVQGGDRFTQPALITDDVVSRIDHLSPLAPLHNPANVAGIEAAREVFPEVGHVAVFDTAFHSTLPPAAYTYAIDREIASKYGIRRYGFHGTSHGYVARRTAQLLGKDPSEVNIIVMHLGNGASITAVRGGLSVDTSMGLTPLEGLMMGSRSGNIDPAVIFHLQRVAGMTTDQIDTLLNRKSGMLGMTGSNDMRDVHEMAAGDGEDAFDAQLALEVYCHRLQHYIGAYYAQLGRLDAIAFTAGVGENDEWVRENSLSGLSQMGIQIDAQRNGDRSQPEREISTDDSTVRVFVVPTDEESEIARQTLDVLFP